MDKRLTTINNNLPLSQQIKNALQSIKVKNATPKEIGITISDSIDSVIFYLGLNTPKEDINKIKLVVIEDVNQHFPSLTIEEISIALNNGCRAMYGEVMGFAPKDAYNWIYAFSQSQERKEVVVAVEKDQLKTIRPTDEEIKRVAWNNLLSAWTFFKKDGYYKDYGNVIYDQLVLNGKINYTKEQREDFKRIAKSNLSREFNPINSIANSIKMLENKKILAEINLNENHARIISEAKKVALNHFFKELQEIGSEIEDLF